MVEIPPQEVKMNHEVVRARAAVAVESVDQPTNSNLSGMDLVNALKQESWYYNQAVHISQTAARRARFAEPKAVLHPLLKEVLLENLRGRTLEHADELKLR